MSYPVGPYPGRLVLHTGKPTWNKVAAGCCGVLYGFAVAVLALIVGALFGNVTGIVVGLLIALLGMAPLVMLFVGVMREKTWLEGTAVVVRGMMRTRRCDLAQARWTEFGAAMVAQSYRSPMLRAYRGDSGKCVEVRLHDFKTVSWIRPEALHALAAAIAAGQPNRPQEAAIRSQQVIDGLRGIADHPMRNLL